MMRVGGACPEPLNSVRFDIVPYTRGKGLDIGVGEYKAFPHFIGVRRKDDAAIAAPVTADFLVDDLLHIAEFVEGSLDFVFVWGVDDTTAIAEAASALVKEGGHVLTVTPEGDGSALRVVRRTATGFVPATVHGKFDDTPTVCVIRYGAIGDMIQTSSLMPELKRQGYHVTLSCHPNGEELLRLDPHIDHFMVQDPDQVPNQELHQYWAQLARRFDRVVNMCETVEGTWLANPGRAQHRWPHAVRHKYLNGNYLQFMAEVAELPYIPGTKFYPSPEEEAKVASILEGINDRVNKDLVFGERARTPFVVTIALAGSSVHKFNPHVDAIMARMMLEIPHVHVCLIGDEFARVLEAGWQAENRVSMLSGVLSIREAMTLAQKSQLVIGPETGVLNAVAFETNAKVVFLSHSSEENLTRDWTNTSSVFSHVTPCYPCHQLHYDHTYCPQDATSGAAMCQSDMNPADIWDAVQRAYIGWGTVRRLTEIR